MFWALPVAATAAAIFLGLHYRATAIRLLEPNPGHDRRRNARAARKITVAAILLVVLVVAAIWWMPS